MSDHAASIQPKDGQVRTHGGMLSALTLILLVAFFLRVYDLGRTPLGVHYDEAANMILSNEIAQGARPVFIRGYTGKEVLYFYLAAVVIRLMGHPPIAVRVASALIGTASIAIAYRTARELFAEEANGHGRWIALIAAAIQAVNLWAITVSRLGYRAHVQPPLQALTLLFVYRGLRHPNTAGGTRGPLLDWVWAGVWCGLSAYTYLAVRAFPILLALTFLWIVVFWPPRRPGAETPSALRSRLPRLAQFGVLLLVAAVVFAPLGAFYLRNPEFFATRMGQVSVFSPEVGGADPWAAFWRAVRVSFGMFTVRGDLNWRFNVAGAPALWFPLGVFFYVGLAIGLWRLFASAARITLTQRTTYFVLLVWLPVMLLPSILGGGGVEVSLSLRAIGVMPALFYWPALGLTEGASALRRLLGRWLARPTARRIASALVGALLVATGIVTSIQCFVLWGPSVPGYYAASGYLVEASEYVDDRLPPEADLYFAAEHYRHPTVAVLSRRYPDIKWLVGPDVLVFPAGSERETWYVFTHEAMPAEDVLDRFLGTPAQVGRTPDGEVAFRAYSFPPGGVPVPQPSTGAEANLGNVLRFLGYDLNGPLASGGTLDVTLYWQALRDGDRDDFTFFAHLVDDLGFQWGGETFFTYPSIQWRRGEVMALRSRFPIWQGAPPGPYALDVGVFSPSLDARLPLLNENGGLAGTTIHLDGFDLRRADRPPDELPPIQQPARATYGPGLTLLGHDRDRGDLRPGETLALSLYWQAEEVIEPGTMLSLWLEGAGGRIPLWEGDPVHGRYPFSQWQPPEFVRDRYALRLPTDVGAGDYDLHLALLRADGTPLPTSDGHDALSLSAIHVRASDRLWEPPEGIRPVGARLGERVELLGYDLEREEARAGETLHLTLVWRCLSEMDTSYTVFTHLLDEGEQVRGQQDNPPVAGRYPTTLWVVGEVVVDRYDIEVQGDAPPGMYAIEVGMYDPANVQRLAVLDPTGAVGDRVLLGNVRVDQAN